MHRGGSETPELQKLKSAFQVNFMTHTFLLLQLVMRHFPSDCELFLSTFEAAPRLMFPNIVQQQWRPSATSFPHRIRFQTLSRAFTMKD